MTDILTRARQAGYDVEGDQEYWTAVSRLDLDGFDVVPVGLILSGNFFTVRFCSDDQTRCTIEIWDYPDRSFVVQSNQALFLVHRESPVVPPLMPEDHEHQRMYKFFFGS